MYVQCTYIHVQSCLLLLSKATNVYGVSEGDMIHYHNVFADSGNTGAQVRVYHS